MACRAWQFYYLTLYRKSLPVFVVAVQSLSYVLLVGDPWTVAPQTPLSMGFPRQEY